MVTEVLLRHSDFTLLFEILALYRDREVILVSFLDLHDHADRHSFLCKGHLDDTIEHGTAESDFLNRTDRVHRTNFNESKLL